MTRSRWLLGPLTAAAITIVVAGCGGSGNPLDNPQSVANPNGSAAGQKLSFAYFQYCVQPIVTKDLQIVIDGKTSINQCASSGCHDSIKGNGGAFRLVGSATDESVTPVTEADKAALRTTPMYKNYYSAQGSAVVGSVSLSNLLNKPRVFRVLHGGGLIFLDETDPNVKVIEYWITHPAPRSGDEFSDSGGLFTNGVPRANECKTQ